MMYRALRISPTKVQFPGLDLGGGMDTASIIAEHSVVNPGPGGVHSIIVIKTPAASVWLGQGEGYRYTPIRYEVYRLEANPEAAKHGGDLRERKATLLISFPARQERGTEAIRSTLKKRRQCAARSLISTTTTKPKGR